MSSVVLFLLLLLLFYFVLVDVSSADDIDDLCFPSGDFADFLLEYMAEEDDEDLDAIKHDLEDTMGREEFRRELSRKASVTSQDHNEQAERQRRASVEAGDRRNVSESAEVTRDDGGMDSVRNKSFIINTRFLLLAGCT